MNSGLYVMFSTGLDDKTNNVIRLRCIEKNIASPTNLTSCLRFEDTLAQQNAVE